MEMTERAAATLGAKPEVDKVVAAGRSAPPTMKRRRDLMQHAPCWRADLRKKIARDSALAVRRSADPAD